MYRSKVPKEMKNKNIFLSMEEAEKQDKYYNELEFGTLKWTTYSEYFESFEKYGKPLIGLINKDSTFTDKGKPQYAGTDVPDKTKTKTDDER